MKNILLFSLITLLTIGGMFLLFPEVAQAAFSCDSGTTDTTCYVTSTKVLDDGETISGTGNLYIISGGELTTAAGDRFYIDMGGDIVVNGTSSEAKITGNFNATSTNFTIENATSSINVSAKGYAGGAAKGDGSGDGGGTGGDNSPSGELGGGGAGYGGNGGKGDTGTPGGDSYGFLIQPTHLGSGGGGGYTSASVGGAGGGAVKLNVSGTTTISGSITANGANGGVEGTCGGGGGSGGSIWIITGTLAGDSSITANGGNSGNSTSHDGGGGAGGRIAIYYTTSTFDGTKSASGGTGYAEEAGEAGSIIEFYGPSYENVIASLGTGNLSGSYNNVTITGSLTSITVESATTLNITNLTLQSSAKLTNYGSLIIGSFTFESGTFTLSSGTCDFPVSFTQEGGTFNFNGGTLTLTTLTISNGGTFNYNGGTFTDLTTLTIAGTFNLNTALSFTDVTIQSGGVLSHAQGDPDFDLTVTSDLIIELGGSIDVSGKGYTGGAAKGDGSGTGGGTGGDNDPNGEKGGGGAGYGGNGGKGQTITPGGDSYGFLIQPTHLGSGGGGGYLSGGGAGGGAVKLNVSGTTTISGSITANGANGGVGCNSACYGGGGGSGGSIWIITGTLAGTSSITANGGNGGNTQYKGGGGAGGRIAIYYTEKTYTGSTTASGGTGYEDGGAGTIYQEQKTSWDGGGDGSSWEDGSNWSGDVVPGATENVTIDANVTVNINGTTTINSLTIGNAAGTTSLTLNFAYDAITNGALIIDDGNLTMYSGANITHSAGTGAVVGTVYIGVQTGDATVNSGASIDISGKGYRGGLSDGNPSEHGEGKGGTGPTYGGGEGYAAGYYWPGGGGAYGGDGGQGRCGNNYRSGGTAYGSPTEPTDFGAGGGGVFQTFYPGGNGGGAIKITVSGTTTVNGTIKADGKDAPAGYTGIYQRLPGGGAGGSIWITTGTLAGDGTTTANGGNGFPENSNKGGGGAGGRIAVYYTEKTYTGSITAFGGTGYEAGGAGTIFQRADSQTYGDLLVDNNNVSGADTPFMDGTYTFDNITFQKRANLVLSSGDAVTTTNLTIQDNATLTTTGSLTADTTFTFTTGIFTLNNGTTTLPTSYNLTLEGTFNFTGGTLNNLAGLDILSGGAFTFDNSAETINLTAFTLQSGGTFNLNEGTFNTPASLSCEGTFNCNGGTINNLTTITVSSGGTFNYNGGAFADLTTLTITGTFNLNAALSLTDVTIQSGGVLSHTPRDPDFDLTVTSDLIIDSGGSIDVSGKGYRGGYSDGNASPDGEGKGGTGPTYGGGEGYTNYPNPGGGGAYGGDGGQGRVGGNYRSGGTAYGSSIEPTDFGAGGGGVAASSWPGGNGGGAIKITVSGTTTVNGTIKADGQSAPYGYTSTATYYRLPGGGAGGSIWITAGILAGEGAITANGGNGYYKDSTNWGGGGAGGRIAVYYTEKTYTDSITAFGGTGYQAGGAGTIYTKAGSQTYGDLLVDNNNVSGADTPFMDGTYTFDNITFQKRANLVLSSGDAVTTTNLTIQDNATLTTTGSLTADTTFTFTTGIFTLDNGTTTLPTSYNLTLEGTFNFTGGILNNLVGLNILSGGTFTFDNSAETIDLTTFTLQSGGTFNLNEGTLNAPASLDCEGTFNYNGGTINNLTTITVSSEGTFNYNGGTFTDLTTLTIAGTFNLNAALSLTDVTIQSGGVLSHTPRDPDFDLTVTSDLIIELGGSIDVSGKGYRGGYSDGNPSPDGEGKGGTGPTYGGGEGNASYCNPGGGGAYGGDGGQGRREGTYRSGGTAYGSFTEPTDLGGGGGGVQSSGYPGGNGGGAIKITVSGTTTVNGTIRADGQSATDGRTGSYERLPGGGAGGSIWITARTLAGNGTTTANGGNGFYEHSTHWGGGGAGGRIALYRQTDTFSGSTTVNGGTGYESGGEGTIFLFFLNQAPNPPTFLSQYKFNCSTLISPGNWTNETKVCLKGNIEDPDGSDQVKLQAEVVTSNDAFTDVLNYIASAYCTSTCTSTVNVASLTHGTQYRWQARAIDDDAATSSFSQFNLGDIAFGVDTTAPTSVSIVSISADSTSQLTITATATDPISGPHSTPYFFKEISGNPGASSSTNWQSPPDFADTGLLTNTQYTYQVKARDVAGNESGYSSLVSKYTLANPLSNLTLTADSPNQITAAWQANNNPEGTEYFSENITRGTDSGWITTLTWVSSDLSPGTEYAFRVKARNGDEVSASWTSEESLSTLSAGGGTPISSPVSITGQGNVSQNLGGEISQTFNSGKTAKVVFPPFSIEGTIVTKIEPQVKAKVIKNNPLPQNTLIIGDLVADFKALSGIKEITQFKKETTITFTYTDKQIKEAKINEKTLKIYWRNKSAETWEPLKSEVNTLTNAVTAQTSHFTLFALIGETEEKPPEEVEEEITEEAPAIIYQGIPPDFTLENNLRYNDKNEEVKYLQIILKTETPETYPSDIPATGWFGPITKTSVIAFQEKYLTEILTPWGLTEGTGFIGQTTRTKLNSLLSALPSEEEEVTPEISEIPADYQFTQPLTLNSQGNDVRYLQLFLKAQGTEIYPEALITGYFGYLTLNAVERFQLKYGIITPEAGPQITGYVGPKTRAKINEILGR